MRNRKLLLSIASLSAVTAIVACAEIGDVSSDQDEDMVRPGPIKPIGGGDAKPPSGTLTCADGEYPWTDSGGKPICAKPGSSDDNPAEYDPGMPSDEEVGVLCKTQTVPLPTATAVASATTECVNGKPPLYKSVLEFYRFDINSDILGKVGEHSTTRVIRYRWDWDATLNAGAGGYKDPVEDARTDHANHWAKDDNRLKRYALIDTNRTDVNGAGFKAYVSTASTYCPCSTDVGHKTDKDSCYGFASANPFEVEIHVCHSDTGVQGRNFQKAAGKAVTFSYECGDGLVRRNAPSP